MDYLTLHELAHQFNKPERQIRYRFHELAKAGKLVEGEDFRKEDFVDEFHFAYKIDPLRFMEEAKLVLDHQVVNNIAGNTEDIGSKRASNQGAMPEPMGTADDEFGYQGDSNHSQEVGQSASKPSESDTKFGSDPSGAVGNEVLLDYVETMKEQLRVKDGQIESYRQQLDDQSGVTRAAITELLKMKDQMLRLTGKRGKDEEQEEPWSAPASER